MDFLNGGVAELGLSDFHELIPSRVSKAGVVVVPLRVGPKLLALVDPPILAGPLK